MQAEHQSTPGPGRGSPAQSSIARDDASGAVRRISLVVPVFNEAAVLGAFFDQLSAAMGTIAGIEYEVVCVNDGSTDESLRVLLECRARDARVKIVDFSRNFGKEAALTAGIDFASGDAVIPIDADLQHPPAKIAEMVELWRQGHLVVLAKRRSRETDGPMRRFMSASFYEIINRLSDFEIPSGVGDFRLMDRKVVDAVKQLRERKRFMKGLFAWTGFPSATIEYDVAPRQRGVSSFNFRRLLSFAIDGIFSFSSLPLRLWSYIGAVVALAALGYGIWIVVQTVWMGVQTPGYASIMVAMLGLGGIQLIGIGVLGEYLGRVYGETKQRPIYVVNKAYL